MERTDLEMENLGTISGDEIKIILDRYRIGKKPLAKLLGWGETTIIRYMEGDVPTCEYSNKLKTILDNPEYYYDLLLQRRDCLTSVAFKKSKRAALSKILSSKINAVAYYLVNRADAEICASSVQFLLYYIQAFSLALYDKEMFQEEYAINSEGVPYLKLYEGMKRTGIRTLEIGEDYLTAEEKKLIEEVQDSFSWYGPKTFQTMLTQEKQFYKISRDKYNNKIISKETIKTHFKEIMEKYRIKNVKDVGKYPDQKFMDIKELYL